MLFDSYRKRAHVAQGAKTPKGEKKVEKQKDN